MCHEFNRFFIIKRQGCQRKLRFKEEKKKWAGLALTGHKKILTASFVSDIVRILSNCVSLDLECLRKGGELETEAFARKFLNFRVWKITTNAERFVPYQGGGPFRKARREDVCG